MAAQVFKVQPNPDPKPTQGIPSLPSTKSWSTVWFGILQGWAGLILACVICGPLLGVAGAFQIGHPNSVLAMFSLFLVVPFLGCFVHTVYTLAVLINWCQHKKED